MSSAGFRALAHARPNGRSVRACATRRFSPCCAPHQTVHGIGGMSRANKAGSGQETATGFPFADPSSVTGLRPTPPPPGSRALLRAMWFVVTALGCSDRATNAAPPAADIDLRSSSRAVLPDTFTYVSSLRPLSDGSVLITDPREQRVEQFRFDGSRGIAVARQGLGPHEWSRAVGLVSACGDRNFQFDPAARRLHLFERTRVVRVFAPDRTPAVGALLAGAAGDSVIYFVQPPPPPVTERSDLRLGDSLALVRVRLRSLAHDTVAMLRDAPGRVVRGADESGVLQPVAIARPAFAAGEQAAAFCDGWVAIVRVDPYRVEWRSPDGDVQRGPLVSQSPRVLTDAMKQDYLDATADQRQALASAPPAVRSALLARFEEFPTQLPPITTFALIAADDGLLYVRKPRLPSDVGQQYDLFDRSGSRVAILTLAPSEQLIAATRSHLFTVITGSLDEQLVARYARPRVRPLGDDP